MQISGIIKFRKILNSNGGEWHSDNDSGYELKVKTVMKIDI